MANICKYVEDPEIKSILLEKDQGKKGENGSIGTVATRGEIVSKLIKNNFLNWMEKISIYRIGERILSPVTKRNIICRYYSKMVVDAGADKKGSRKRSECDSKICY